MLFKTKKGYFNKFWYWLFSCTWGLLNTLIGLICMICVLPFTRNIHFYAGAIVTFIDYSYGSFNFGPFLFIYKNCNNWPVEYRRIHEHEYGHSIQTFYFGPLQLFLVDIPSIVRFWHRKWIETHKKNYYLPPYDAAWFEHMATSLGAKYRYL